MLQHHHHQHHYQQLPLLPADVSLARHSKRKSAETPEGNERLSKRLSLLNLENGGTRLYVPVESAKPSPTIVSSSGTPPAQQTRNAPLPSALPRPLDGTQTAPPPSSSRRRPGTTTPADDDMHVDDTKYKVYIYNIDDELASDNDNNNDDDDDDDDESGVRSGKYGIRSPAGNDEAGQRLFFLPGVDKRLRDAARDNALRHSNGTAHRKLAIPRPILPNRDGELAGMQLVLYNDPSSLSVPREHDSVRQAILDTRARYRARQQEKEEAAAAAAEQQMAQANAQPGAEQGDAMSTTPLTPAGNDPDAMDLD
ncbi:hypothetical protein SPI_04888 [Niveomyces insectorum RCEF 264]|uniref:Uncharacterized protein n=1 Tax=Niveomyces insectorum RCEF 264 TaxID=1081102 RepID=A0A167UY97_9HYPO|nr:hypothetical protein SPI_04888 [Niveomyces insectorum RCEF 264]